jgi:hypothetical protein
MNMKFWNAGYGKAEDQIHVVKNAEASAEIPAGTPVIYALNGTDDGLAVVLPSSSTAAKASVLMAGITVKTMPVGKIDNVQVYGFNRFTRVYRGSRAATTDAWPTFAAFAIGDILQVNTVANAMASSGTGPQTAFQPMVVVAEVVASVATQASSVLGTNPATNLSFYQGVKTFLRFM